MGIPYEKVRPGTDAMREIQKILAAFGCQSFGTMTDNDRQVAIVMFKWRDRQVQLEASWSGYAQALVTKRDAALDMPSARSTRSCAIGSRDRRPPSSAGC